MERKKLDDAKTSFTVKKADLIKWVAEYIELLVLEEKSALTLQQYRHDILQFIKWMDEREESGRGTDDKREANSTTAGSIAADGTNTDTAAAEISPADCVELTKEAVIAYKEKLREVYEVSTVNAKLAALNGFLSCVGMADLRVKQFKLQRRTFCSREKELTQAEYERLVKAADKTGDERLKMILETMCSTGIRVSELKFITVEAVTNGETVIQLKGKTRPLLLPLRLRNLLKDYIKRRGLVKGPVFVTSTGRELDRSNIWRMMKSLCEIAHVEPGKVFPHDRVIIRTSQENPVISGLQ